jgi:CelD/BcsL family acetyltransferase involved in cellulose biosynthesis
MYDDEHKRRMIQAAEKGWLRAYILYINEKPAAFWILTRYKKKCLSNFLGFDAQYAKYSPGMVLFARLMEDLCRETDLEKIDFGSGDAVYKKRFGDNGWLEADIMIFSPTFYGLKLNLMRTIVIGFSLILEILVARLGLLNRVKKIWRNRLKK